MGALAKEYIPFLGIILLTVIIAVYLACYILSKVLNACLQPLEAHQTELLHLAKQKQDNSEMNSKNKSFMIWQLKLKVSQWDKEELNSDGTWEWANTNIWSISHV